MADFIVLSAGQADQVRGESAPGSALAPVRRQGDLFILGVAVLDDPAHAEHRDYLSALPVMADDDPEFPPAIPVVMAGMEKAPVPRQTSDRRPRGRPKKS